MPLFFLLLKCEFFCEGDEISSETQMDDDV